MKNGIDENWNRNLEIEKNAAVKLIEGKIEYARNELKKSNLQYAKELYVEISGIYCDLDSKDQSKVYDDVYELYDGIKKAEKSKILEPITGLVKYARKVDNKFVKYSVLVAMLLLIISVFFMLKPEITGYIVFTQEKAYEDSLNLVINESGRHIWNPNNIGDINSIMASGKVKGNGTVKIYVEKDGKRYLIYDNKNSK